MSTCMIYFYVQLCGFLGSDFYSSACPHRFSRFTRTNNTDKSLHGLIIIKINKYFATILFCIMSRGF